MSDDAYQAFFARGSVKKKFDGTNFYNWGIARPTTKPTLAAIAAITKTAAIFASSGETDIPTSSISSEFTINEGTSNFVNDFA